MVEEVEDLAEALAVAVASAETDSEETDSATSSHSRYLMYHNIPSRAWVVHCSPVGGPSFLEVEVGAEEEESGGLHTSAAHGSLPLSDHSSRSFGARKIAA